MQCRTSAPWGVWHRQHGRSSIAITAAPELFRMHAGTAAAYASADSRTGKVADAGRHRLLQLSRGADKRSDTDRVSLPRHQPVATHAAAAKSEGLDDQGTDRAVGQRLAPTTANPSPLARCALRSQTPEVGEAMGRGGGGCGTFIVHTN
jgi:hypothetical protein